MNRLCLLGLLVIAPFGACASESWTLERKTDPMTDRATCRIFPTTDARGGLLVLVTDGAVNFSSIERRVPGSAVRFRVDDADPMTYRDTLEHLNTSVIGVGGSRDNRAAGLLAQLRSGTRLRVQSSRWPDSQTVDWEGPVGDLPALIDTCLRAQESPE